MSLGAVAVAALFALGAAYNLAELLELGACNRGHGRRAVAEPEASWLQNEAYVRREWRKNIRTWFRWWRRQPRPTLRVRDWLPHNGRLFMPSWVGLILLILGGEVLFGPDQTSRVGGLLAVLGSLPLLTLVTFYVLRPASATRKHPGD